MKRSILSKCKLSLHKISLIGMVCSAALAICQSLSAADAAPEAAAPKDDAKLDAGFVSLFDGNSLKGWQGNTKAYEAKEGVLKSKAGIGGNLYTDKEYGDFVFRFDFKLVSGANNGIGIHTPMQGDAAYVGMEIQVLDDTAPEYAKLHPYQYHGSIYGVVPAKQGHLKPVGEWNSEEITVQGRHVKVVLNGTTIVDANLDEAAPKGKTIDGKHHPGLARDKGYIALLGHTKVLEFRNLSIKTL